jgi:hypothetical protein
MAPSVRQPFHHQSGTLKVEDARVGALAAGFAFDAFVVRAVLVLRVSAILIERNNLALGERSWSNSPTPTIVPSTNASEDAADNNEGVEYDESEEAGAEAQLVLVALDHDRFLVDRGYRSEPVGGFKVDGVSVDSISVGSAVSSSSVILILGNALPAGALSILEHRDLARTTATA